MTVRHQPEHAQHDLLPNLDPPPQKPLIRRFVLGFWALVLIAVPIWMYFDPPGWDVQIYLAGVRSVMAGHDPYADAMAIQRAFHATMALHPGAAPPYSYVYSPITLPVLRLVGILPLILSGLVYSALYVLGVLTEIWVGFQAVEPRERRLFLFLAPVAAFFPGLLANGIVLSGNVAFILYALMFGTAVYAWKRGTWTFFYLAVLIASCFKAPLLSLIVLPILTARRQWIQAGITAALGLALFAIQPLLWPTLFAHYLQAVELQFSFNRDFGCSPAGLFAGVLFDHGIPYSPGTYLFYLAYAIPLFGLLFYLSRQFLRGAFSLRQWLPVLMVGVILLNPRLIEYDVAPLALPLALIAWRFLTSITSTTRAAIAFALFFLATNAIASLGWTVRKLTDGPLLVVLFLAGAWTLYRQSRLIPLAEPQ